MHIIKTRKQSIVHRVFEDGSHYYFVVSVFHFFRFGSRSLLPETSLWPFVAEELGKDAIIDICMPKMHGEVLLSAKCFARERTPVPASIAGIKIGAIHKTLDIFGNRYWSGSRGMQMISEPEPFTVMDINYANAFGGPNYPDNPIGKGIEAIGRGEKETVRPLPNIEFPSKLIGSPDDNPGPAGFGPIDIMWPQRMRKAGTYDDKWLKERFPGLAADMDFTYFNMAQEDQWADGYFLGEETFSLINMHPEKPVIESRLPGFRPRIFLNIRRDQSEPLREIDTRLDTIWLFPHAERGVLIHRGTVEIGTDDAEDVLHLLAGYESTAEAPLPREHYAQEFEKRTDEKKGYLFILRDKGLAPESEAAGQAEEDAADGAMYESEHLVAKHGLKKAEKQIEKMKKQFESFGLDPKEYIPVIPAPPPRANPANFDVEEIEKMVANAREEAEKRKTEALEKAKKLCAKFGLDFDKLREDAMKKMKGKPKISSDEFLKLMKKLGVENPEIEKKLHAAEAKIELAYKQFAHVFPEQAPLSPEESGRKREDFLAQLARGKDFRGVDCTGMDFSGLNLSGIDFREAILDGANLSETDLTGADLRKAILARANFTGARLAGANLEEANLGKTDLTKCDLHGANLSAAVLFEANISETNFTDVSLARADLFKAVFRKPIFTGAKLPAALFIECDLTGVSFAGADLTKAIFIKPVLHHADFAAGILRGAIFVTAQAENAIFKNADCTNIRCVMNSNFKNSDFSGAILNAANFMDADLTKAVFSSAIMHEANFMNAHMGGSDLRWADAVRANFRKADFTEANLEKSNCMESNFSKARLVDAKLRNSNFYGAEFMRAVLGNTDFGGTNLKKTKLEKWIPNE